MPHPTITQYLVHDHTVELQREAAVARLRGHVRAVQDRTVWPRTLRRLRAACLCLPARAASASPIRWKGGYDRAPK